MQPTPPLPEELVEYVDQLLAGTGLSCEDALAIAGGVVDADGVADPRVIEALRAGWSAATVAATTAITETDNPTQTRKDRS